MASKGSKTYNPDTDVHITFEDQQKINNFAKSNAKLDDYKDELKAKQNKLKNLEDACDEIMLLDEDTEKIPYSKGEIFVYHNLEETQKKLDQEKARVLEQIKELEGKSMKLKNEMSDMKTVLYAKFGTNINLESEDD